MAWWGWLVIFVGLCVVRFMRAWTKPIPDDPASADLSIYDISDGLKQLGARMHRDYSLEKAHLRGKAIDVQLFLPQSKTLSSLAAPCSWCWR